MLLVTFSALSIRVFMSLSQHLRQMLEAWAWGLLSHWWLQVARSLHPLSRAAVMLRGVLLCVLSSPRHVLHCCRCSCVRPCPSHMPQMSMGVVEKLDVCVDAPPRIRALAISRASSLSCGLTKLCRAGLCLAAVLSASIHCFAG